MSDWVLATEESGYTRHFDAEALPVRIGGGAGDDLSLAGVEGSVVIGMLDDVFFVQPGRDTRNVRLDGEPLHGSKRLEDGMIVALDSARLTCRMRGKRLTLAIEAQVTAGDTAPPDLDELARMQAAEVEIAPVAFRPLGSGDERPGTRRLSVASMAVGAMFLVLAVLAWFTFTAKSVEFVFDPSVDEMSLPSTLFQFRIGDRYLLRSGKHHLTASLDGYYPVDETIEVGALPDQTVRLNLTKLPGLITFGTEPEVSAEVTVDGKPLGSTPLEDVEIVPGTHRIEFVAERYLSEVRELDVEGGHVEQDLVVGLTPSWAPVQVTSKPDGAEVSVDGKAFGRTPIELELSAGERRIEVGLAGYNTWNDRIMVVADVPQVLPEIALTLADARLSLASVPNDASVSVDNQYRGRTPLSLSLTPGRAHSISVAKPGFEPATRELTLAADSERALSIELVAQYGEVDVQSLPEGAEIWVDDRLAGTTPTRLHLMAVSQQIEVRADGFASEHREITPRPGYPQALMFELEMLDESSGSGYPRSILTSAGQELRLVPAGAFTMGSSRRDAVRRSNEPLRDVELSSSFYLGVHEVTNAEFRALMPEHDSGEFGGLSLNGDDQPVVRVSWEDAAEYMNRLSVADGLQPVYVEASNGLEAFRPLRNGYRFPTEAEWAWASRAAGREAAMIYPWGDDARPPTDRFANVADLSAAEILPTTLVTYNDGFAVTAPVGSFAANAVGIFDLGGNAAEWVQDFYGINVVPSEGVETDPLGPESGRFHVIRGPSWRSATAQDLRLAYRINSADVREDVGFRIARNLE